VAEIEVDEPQEDPRDRDADRETDAETLTSWMDVAQLFGRPAHPAEPRAFTQTSSVRSRTRT
jgi:hypothetical protein